MKLGFVSSILDGWSFEEMIDTAAQDVERLRHRDLNVSRSHAGLVQGRQREGMRGCAILIQRRLMIRRRSTS